MFQTSFKFGSPPPGAWLGTVFFGLLLVGFGVVILVVPYVLEFIVAGVFILLGTTVAGLGVGMRPRVTYRRMDEEREDSGFLP